MAQDRKVSKDRMEEDETAKGRALPNRQGILGSGVGIEAQAVRIRSGRHGAPFA
jgi:hypothetical protein